LFQWGSFEFIGLVESYEETLDFFSKEGRPLRATVSLKMKEDRFQFRQRTDGVAAANNTQPSFENTGANPTTDDDGGTPEGLGGLPGGNQNTNQVPGNSKDGTGSWRDNALFNGVENPRLPSAPSLALPKAGLTANVSLNADAGFKFGQSASLGSAIPGSFCTNKSGPKLNAADLINSIADSNKTTSQLDVSKSLTSKFSVGFD
jgi:hypothetical protein